jgi:peptidoglycan DL-endopeptidase RipA
VNVCRSRGLAGRTAALASVIALTAGLLIAPQIARADPPPTNPSDSQINSAQARKTALADRVGKLSAQVADLQNQVEQREAAAELAEQKLADALQKLADAQAAAAAARAQLTQAQKDVDKATQRFSDFVRASYMDSPITGPASGLLTAPDPNSLLSRSDYLQYSAAHKLDVIGALSKAKVAQSNADAGARAAEQRQATAKDNAAKAKTAADDALSAAQAERDQLNSTLASTQSALSTARLQLATLNNQRAKYLAWQREQARIAAAKAAAEAAARARAAAAAAAAAAANSWHPSSPSAPTPPPSGGSWSAMAGRTAVDRAMRYLGIAYAFAAGGYSGPSYGVCVSGDAFNDCNVYGFDCSGLAMYAWGPYIHMDHYAATQYGQAGSYHPGTSSLMPGDLVFWSSDGTQAGIHHVAIYIGGGTVIQAPQSGDVVRITPLGDVDSGYFGATRPLT